MVWAVQKDFSPKQVADALRVSESSIKRWCDRGAIQTLKTLGGHRRIPLDSLLAFLESTNREIADYSQLDIGPAPEGVKASPAEAAEERPGLLAGLQESLEAALIRGDERECRRTMIEWYDRQGSFSNLADDLIASTFRRLGELWRQGRLEIFQERRAVELCSRLTHEFRRLFADPPATAPYALGGTLSGDHYMLIGQLIEVTLREIGWRAVNLGVNLPFASYAEAVRRERPRLVWLSVSHVDDKPQFIEDFRKFWSTLPQDTALVVGGRELTDNLRPQLNFTAHCDTMQQLASFAKSLKANQPVRSSNPI